MSIIADKLVVFDSNARFRKKLRMTSRDSPFWADTGTLITMDWDVGTVLASYRRTLVGTVLTSFDRRTLVKATVTENDVKSLSAGRHIDFDSRIVDLCLLCSPNGSQSCSIDGIVVGLRSGTILVLEKNLTSTRFRIEVNTSTLCRLSFRLDTQRNISTLRCHYTGFVIELTSNDFGDFLSQALQHSPAKENEALSDMMVQLCTGTFLTMCVLNIPAEDGTHSYFADCDPRDIIPPEFDQLCEGIQSQHQNALARSGRFYVSTGMTSQFITVHSSFATPSSGVTFFDDADRMAVLKKELTFYCGDEDIAYKYFELRAMARDGKLVSKFDKLTAEPNYRCRHAVLSPDQRLVALSDVRGRVMVFLILRSVILRLLKGYRDAQLSWFTTLSTQHGSHPAPCQVLVVFAPRRGIVELWPGECGQRLAVFNVGKRDRLFLCNTGLSNMARTFLLNEKHSSIFDIKYHGNLLTTQEDKDPWMTELLHDLTLLSTDSWDKSLWGTVESRLQNVPDDIVRKVLSSCYVHTNIADIVLKRLIDTIRNNVEGSPKSECEILAAAMEMIGDVSRHHLRDTQEFQLSLDGFVDSWFCKTLAADVKDAAKRITVNSSTQMSSTLSLGQFLSSVDTVQSKTNAVRFHRKPTKIFLAIGKSLFSHMAFDNTDAFTEYYQNLPISPDCKEDMLTSCLVDQVYDLSKDFDNVNRLLQHIGTERFRNELEIRIRSTGQHYLNSFILLRLLASTENEEQADYYDNMSIVFLIYAVLSNMDMQPGNVEHSISSNIGYLRNLIVSYAIERNFENQLISKDEIPSPMQFKGQIQLLQQLVLCVLSSDQLCIEVVIQKTDQLRDLIESHRADPTHCGQLMATIRELDSSSYRRVAIVYAYLTCFGHCVGRICELMCKAQRRPSSRVIEQCTGLNESTCLCVMGIAEDILHQLLTTIDDPVDSELLKHFNRSSQYGWRTTYTSLSDVASQLIRQQSSKSLESLGDHLSVLMVLKTLVSFSMPVVSMYSLFNALVVESVKKVELFRSLNLSTEPNSAMQFKRRQFCSSYASEVMNKKFQGSQINEAANGKERSVYLDQWINFGATLADGLGVDRDSVHRNFARLIYAYGLDDIAEEYTRLCKHKDVLAVDLMNVLAIRMRYIMEAADSSDILKTALPVDLYDWINEVDTSDHTVKWTTVEGTHRLLDFICEHIPSRSCLREYAEKLRSVLSICITADR